MEKEESNVNELIQKYMNGEHSDDENKEIGSLIRTDKEFARSFVREVRMVTALRGLMRTEAGAAALDRKPRPRLFYAAIAAGIAAVLAIGVLFAFLLTRPCDRLLTGELRIVRGRKTVYLKPGEPLRNNDIAAAASVATCQLRDGSTVKLDSGSRAVFSRGGWGERARLKLEEGRVFLRVTKTGGKFILSTGAGDVEVLGTVFGVEKKKDAAAVSIFRGRVAVRSAAGELVVDNGKSARVSAEQKPVLTDVDPNKALLWARERTEFRCRPLGEVIDWIEANSRYTIDAPLMLRKETITITISEIPMADVIEVLSLTFEAEYEIKGNTVVLRKKQDDAQ